MNEVVRQELPLLVTLVSIIKETVNPGCSAELVRSPKEALGLNDAKSVGMIETEICSHFRSLNGTRKSPTPSTLASKEMSDLVEELLALLDMREMCRVLISDPLNLGDIVKKGLHCAFLNILFRPSDEQRGCFDPMKKMYGGPVLQ
jgi:hypothetical protein